MAEILKLADDIPAELRELIVRGAEGNPFYTEELIKMLIEDGVIIPDEETWQIDLTRLRRNRCSFNPGRCTASTIG